MKSIIDTKFGHWTIFILLGLVWGSSFILMKRGLEVYPHSQVAALRMTIAFLCLLPVALRYLYKTNSKALKNIFMVGLLGNFIPAFLFTKAQTGLSSSLVGVLNSLTPLFTVIIGFILFRNRSTKTNIIGVFLGLAGAIGLLMVDGTANFGNNFSFGIYVIVATALYATSVNIIKSKLQKLHPVQIASLALFFVGPLAVAYLITTNFTSVVVNHPRALEGLGYIALLAIFGTALSVIIFNKLIQMTSALFASSVTYLMPVVAVMWGVIDHEVIALEHYFWIILILFGVYLVNKKDALKSSKKNQRPTA
jgi:drug/metabolite transporter (DMT)-like permease